MSKAKTYYYCPECGNKDAIEVTGVAAAILITRKDGTHDGFSYTFESSESIDYSNGDNACCGLCEFAGSMDDFMHDTRWTPTSGRQGHTHTPGPWLIQGENVTDASGGKIAETGFFTEAAIDAANAALIVAAPDLLASLEEILCYEQHNTPEPGSYGEEAYKRAYAVVAKAKGGKA